MPKAASRLFHPLEIVILLAILSLALYLRLGQAGISEFKADEANLSLLALDFAQGGGLPLLGIGSSVGFPNAPVNVYLLSAPYAIASSPLLATQFIGLLNVLAVLLVYVIVRRYTGPIPALLATLLYAISPWGIIFSRKIWAQNMLPPFILLSLWTGLEGLVHGKRWAQWLFLPVLAITGQIHYGAFVIVPGAVYLILQGRRRITRALWGGAVIAVISLLPFVIGLAQANLLSVDTIGDVLATTDSEDETAGLSLSSAALRGAAVIVAGTEIHALAGPERFLDFLAGIPDAYPVFNPMAWLIVAAMLWLSWRSMRSRDARTPVDITLLVLLIFPVLAFSLTWTPFFIHYLIPIVPVAFIIGGLAMNDLWHLTVHRERLRLAMVVVGGGWLTLLMVLQVWLTLSLLDFVDNNATPGGFGTPLYYLLDVRENVLADDPAQVIGLFNGESVNFSGEDRVWQALLFDVPNVRFESNATMVFPAEPAVRLRTGCEPNAATLFHLREGEGCYQVTDSASDESILADFTPVTAESSRFENAVTVVGYAVTGDDDLCVHLLWEIGAPTDTDYFFAVHFYNADDERVAIGDGLSWPGSYWLPGDRVVRRHCVPTPETPVTHVNIGMYTLDAGTFTNLNLINADGVAVGQMFSLDIAAD